MRRPRALLLSVVSAFLLACTLVLAFVAFRQFESARDWVEHTASVKIALRDLERALGDAVAAQRGYLLTGESAFLDAYARARAATDADAAWVRTMTADNAAQQERLGRLDRLLAAERDRLDRGIGARDAGDAMATRASVEHVWETRTDLREVLASIDADEDRLMAIRRARQTRTSQLTVAALALTSILFGAMVLFGAAWRRDTAERERAMHFQERFLGILGHDLRNPLSALLSGIALLRRTLPEANQKHLARMDSSARRMGRMIEQLLDLTRVRLGSGLSLEPAKADLTKIVEEMTDEVLAGRPDGKVVVEHDGPCDGDWDGDRLGQVVSNLVGNAIDHGAHGSEVRVKVAARGQDAEIIVHNEGPPIAPELLEGLFDPFRRGMRESRGPRTQGLGLGLFITREVIRAHGGRVAVESSDRGTTFSVVLPRKQKAG